MKHVAALTLVLSTLASTGAFADAPLSRSSASDQTPYERLSSYFDAAQAMTLDQLPTPEQRKQWACASVSSLVPTEIGDGGDLPVRTRDASAEIAHGPLFPANTGKELLDLLNINGASALSPYNDVRSYTRESASSSDLSVRWIRTGFTDMGSQVTVRQKDGMIFTKWTTLPNDLTMSIGYCWKR